MIDAGSPAGLPAAAVALILLLRVGIRGGLRVLPFRFQPSPRQLVLVALCMAALFSGLTTVLTAEWVMRFDAAVSTCLTPYRARWLLRALLWLTTLGTNAALAGIAMTATWFLWVDRRTRSVLSLWVTFVGAQATSWIAKYAVGRARPVVLESLASAPSPSFPSAHSAGAAATLGFLAYVVTRDLNRRQRFEIAYWTASLIALVGLSRIFLGVHFATDVVGGFLLGGFWLLLGIALCEWIRARQATGPGLFNAAGS